MNRIASLVAGTITTAFVGASIAAVSASQGVLPGWGSTGTQADGSWEDTAQTLKDEWAGVEISADDSTLEAAPAATTAPTVIYIDKEPIVITKEIVVRSQAPAPAPESRGLSGPTAVPSASPDPTSEPTSAPTAAPTGPSFGGGPVAPAGFSGPVPAAPSPTVTAAPPPPAPVGTFASSDTPSAPAWDDDDSDEREEEDDHYEDHEDEHEEEHD